MAQIAHILVIDDDDIILSYLTDILTNHGFRVTQRNDGKNVLDILKNDPVEIVITDIYMDNKDGIEVIREIKKVYDTKIIAISVGDFLPAAKQLGADETLKKPIDPNILINTVNKLLNTT